MLGIVTGLVPGLVPCLVARAGSSAEIYSG